MAALVSWGHGARGRVRKCQLSKHRSYDHAEGPGRAGGRRNGPSPCTKCQHRPGRGPPPAPGRGGAGDLPAAGTKHPTRPCSAGGRDRRWHQWPGEVPRWPGARHGATALAASGGPGAHAGPRFLADSALAACRAATVAQLEQYESHGPGRATAAICGSCTLLPLSARGLCTDPSKCAHFEGHLHTQDAVAQQLEWIGSITL